MLDKNTLQAHSPGNGRAIFELSCAAGYVRVAAVTQADPQRSLRAQRAQVRVKAKAEGLRLVGISEDAGESAHDLKRPGLVRLFTLLNDPTKDGYCARPGPLGASPQSPSMHPQPICRQRC
jgi:hypothetical protein